VFNISYNEIQGLPPIWMFADNVPSWAEGGIDIAVRQDSGFVEGLTCQPYTATTSHWN
jgi:hypothetical protein